MAFSTFPLPDPAPDPVAAAARVAAQADMVDQVMQSFGAVVGGRLTSQQSAVQGVANKLVGAAAKRITSQQQQVSSVTSSAWSGAANRVAQQGDAVNQLRGKLLTAATVAPTSSPLPSTTPSAGTIVGIGTGTTATCPAIQAGEPLLRVTSYPAVCDPGMTMTANGGCVPDPNLGNATPMPPIYCPEPLPPHSLSVFSQGECNVCTYAPTTVSGGGGGDGLLCLPGTAPGLPPGAQPGTPAICVPVQYWCVQCMVGGATTYAVYSDSELPIAMANDPTCALFGGPYDTEQQALDACQAPAGGGGGGGGGGGPVCCPPVFETLQEPDEPFVALTGPPDPGSAALFCPPGSIKWCDNIAGVRKALVAIGNSIVDFILRVYGLGGEKSPSNTATWADLVAALNPFATAARLIFRLLDGTSVDVRQWLVGLIKWWRQFAINMTGCTGTELVSLAILRAVFRCLKGHTIGVNFVLKVDVSLILDVPAIEQTLDAIMAGMCPWVIPSPSNAMTCYSHGLIARDQYECWLLASGYSPEVHDPVLESQQHEQSWQDVMLYGRLFHLPPDQIDDALKQHAGLRDQERLQWEYLYDPIPTFQQWLGWERADVTKPNTVAVFALDTGFADFWAGQGGKESWSHGLREQDAQRDWRAQYRLPGNDQAQQWLREYWPNRPLVNHPFTAEMWAAAVGAENWAPPVEQFLEFNPFRFLTIAEARQGWRRGLVADSDMVDYVRAQGAKPELLPLQVLMEAQDARRAYMRDARGFTYSTLVGALQWGILDIPTVAAEMALQGYRPDMLPVTAAAAVVSYATRQAARGAMMASRKVTQLAISGYAAGTTNKNAAQSALKSAGWTTDSINAVLAAEDGAIAQKLALQALAVVKKAYMGGEIPAAQVVPMLVSVGVTAPRASQYAASWNFERSTTRKMATSGQILRWVQEGLLDAGVARQRLFNLGYKDPDLTLMMLENSQKIAKALAAAEAKAEKASEAQAAKLARAARLAAAAQAAILRQAEHQEPLASLKKEYCDGIITESYAVQRLTDFGYPSGVIANYLADWRANPKCTPSG